MSERMPMGGEQFPEGAPDQNVGSGATPEERETALAGRPDWEKQLIHDIAVHWDVENPSGEDMKTIAAMLDRGRESHKSLREVLSEGFELNDPEVVGRYAKSWEGETGAPSGDDPSPENAPQGGEAEKKSGKREGWERQLACDILGERDAENIPEEKLEDALSTFDSVAAKKSVRTALVDFVGGTPEAMEHYAVQWEKKHGVQTPAESAPQAAEQAPGKKEEKEDPRFEEASAILSALEAEFPRSPLPRNAMEILQEVQGMSIEDAIRKVVEAQRGGNILRYHAGVILHALVPDRFPMPAESPDSESKGKPEPKPEPKAEPEAEPKHETEVVGGNPAGTAPETPQVKVGDFSWIPLGRAAVQGAEEKNGSPSTPDDGAGQEVPKGQEEPQEPPLGGREAFRGGHDDEEGWRERVGEATRRLAERFGVKSLIDGAKIAWSSELADWYTGRAMKLKGELDDRREDAARLEEDRKHLEEEIRKFRAGGEVDGSVLMRMEKDRAKVERNIEEAKEEADRLQSRLEHRNNDRARFENRRNEDCRSVMGRTQERLAPYEERLSDLKLTRGQLDQEIKYDQASRAARRAEIERITKIAEAEKFPSVRRAHREIIKRLEREDRDLAKEIRVRERARGKIDGEIIKADRKANPLRDKYNRLARITQRRGPDTSAAPKKRGEASYDVSDVSGHPMEGPEGNMPGPEMPQSPEDGAQYAGDKLIEGWNKINGSFMTIDLEAARENFPQFFAEPRSVSEFWRFTEFYAERHGDEDRLEGMPNMRKAAKKKRGIWALLFGQKNRVKSQRRFADYLMLN